MMNQEPVPMPYSKSKSVDNSEDAPLAAQPLYPSYFKRGGARLPSISGMCLLKMCLTSSSESFSKLRAFFYLMHACPPLTTSFNVATNTPTDPRMLLDSEALIDASLMIAEADRLALQQRIAALERGVAIAHALRWSTPAFRNTSTTPLTSHFSSPLLQGELAPLYSESALMKDIIVKTNLQLPRSTLPSSDPSTPTVPSEDTLDAVRARHLVTSVPTKGDIMRPTSRPRRQRCLGLTFPAKLLAMLMEAEAKGFDDIISFLPHGNSFMIYRPEKFAKEVMLKYFSTNRLPSFQKQLSLYGFKRTNGGQDHGATYHEFFRRDHQKLVAKISRRKKTVPPYGDGTSR